MGGPYLVTGALRSKERSRVRNTWQTEESGRFKAGEGLSLLLLGEEQLESMRRNGDSLQEQQPEPQNSYFTSKTPSFGNSGGIAIRDKQTMANPKQVQRDKGKVRFYEVLGGNGGELF